VIRRRPVRAWWIGFAVAACGRGTLAQQAATLRVSVRSTRGQADSQSLRPVLSADARFVAFQSFADDLVPGDDNGTGDVFVRDRLHRSTEMVSIDPTGHPGNGGSAAPSISADGRFVAFWSYASNLVSGDNNGMVDVFVHDRQTGTNVRVSVDSAGNEARWGGGGGWISADGRTVAFRSDSDDLVAGDTNSRDDIFVHDLQSGSTERVSVDSSGAQTDDDSYGAAISADGRFVAFDTLATNLVTGDTNGTWDAFVHDRQSGATELVSGDPNGVPGNGESGGPALSADGRFVVFTSVANDLVAADTNGAGDVFVRDRVIGATTRVSVDSSGAEGDGYSYGSATSISADGRWVGFTSGADNLVAGDANGFIDAFLHDGVTGTTRRVSVDSSGTEGDDDVDNDVALSADGRFVAFGSYADDLVVRDTNGFEDIFLHGPWLTLEADPMQAIAGATLTFSTWIGESLGPCMLVVSDVNGTPTFAPAAFATFDADGRWMLSGTVPSGLTGIVCDFETFGIVPTGKIDVSNAVEVSFQ
jgi:Tol biopolymer transport system component